MDAVHAPALAGVRQAGAGRVEHGHHPGERPRGPRGRDRGGPRARPQGRRRGRASSGREIECAVLEGHGTDATRTSRAGRGSSCTNHEFYDFEAKYLAEGDVRLSCPADVPAEVADEIRAMAAAGVRGRSAARGWRGSTSSTPTTGECSSTRSTRCRASRRTRCTRGCGRRRAELPRAHRRADPAGPGAPHRPALTRPGWTGGTGRPAVAGRALATGAKAGSSSGSGRVRLGTSTSIAGSRPKVVNRARR